MFFADELITLLKRKKIQKKFLNAQKKKDIPLFMKSLRKLIIFLKKHK